jgi:hypothetical protein
VRPYLENTHHKKGLEEWFKVKALSSSPSIGKKKKKDRKKNEKQLQPQYPRPLRHN